MGGKSNAVRLLERRFVVRVPLDAAWAHLARVEEWTSWARHIRRIDLSRPTPSCAVRGPLGPDTESVIRLTNGIRSTFRMVELNPGGNWRWDGPFLWLTVRYDHRFERIGPNETEIAFILDAEGFGGATIGRVFAAIYARNLDAAIPHLIAELESLVLPESAEPVQG